MAFCESLYYLALESCLPIESNDQVINTKNIPRTNDEKNEVLGCVG